MVNTKQKGARREKQAKELLESGGWLVERAKMGSRFEKNKDFFHLFDLIALKKVNGITYHRWIQIKSNRCPKKVREEIKEFSKNYLGETDIAEVWIFKDRKGWERTIM
jgi:hypothetical protein